MSTWTIWQGSWRPLTHIPGSNFSRFRLGIDVFIMPYPACVGRISHQGASVSSIKLSAGMDFTTFTKKRERCAGVLNPGEHLS